MLKSLHGRLLAWLIGPLLFLSAAHMVSTWFDTRSTSTAIFDKLLVTLALSISEHALASGGDLLTDELLELIRVTTNDNLYYKVIGPDAAFIMGYDDIPEPPGGIEVLDGNVQFYDAEYLNEAVRVIAVSTLVDRLEFSGWMTTFVAQTVNDRTAFTREILVDNGLRVVVLILIASLLLSVGISLGLRPLLRLQDSLAQRDSHDLSAIERTNLPVEIDSPVAALNDLLKRLSEYMVLTRRFVENASHQLRTPVAALLPQTDLALRHADSDRERAAVGKIRKSAEQIARLTHQLLNLTYAESVGLGKRNFAVVDLARVAERRVAAFSNAHPGVAVRATLDPAAIRGEELLLNEVLDNLLDNAHKYGGEPIGVRTGVVDGRAFLETTDAGAGFPPESLERITERFYRANSTSDGSGLGLAVSREIVLAFGGTLDVGAPQATPGARVTCVFPLAY